MEYLHINAQLIQMLHTPGFAPPRPLEVPFLIAAGGPKGIAVAREVGDGIFGGAMPMGGFASTSTKADGYYSSGPVFRGKYKVYVGDRVNQTKIIVYLDIQSAGERVDFDLAQPCFGRAPCEVVAF